MNHPDTDTCGQCGAILSRAGGEEKRNYCSNCGAVPGAYDTVAPKSLEIKGASQADAQSNLQPASLDKSWLEFARPTNQSESIFAKALAETLRISRALGLPPGVADDAARLCGRAFMKSMTRGSSLEAVAAATVYAACRAKSIGVTVEEVAAVSGSDRTEIVRVFRRLQRELRLSLPAPSIVEYLPRIMASLKLDGRRDVAEAAVQVASKAQELSSAQGKNPSSLAACCVYVASTNLGIGVTQRRLAGAAFVTENTIRRTCSFLREVCEIRVRQPN
jgi:transcription initiation factor TFIIB